MFRVLLGALLLCTLVLYLINVLGAVKAAVIFVAGTLFLLIAFRKVSGRLLRSVEGVNVSTPFGGIGVTARKAAAQSPESEAESDTASDAPADDLISLRFKLEAKLAYVAKHLLNEQGVNESKPAVFLTIGSLRYDGYISEEQAEVASQILTMQQRDYAAMPSAKREAWVANANDLATNIRASVFSAMVRKRLEKAEWYVGEMPRKDAKGADFLAVKGGNSIGEHYRVIPTYALRQNSGILRSARERLSQHHGNESSGHQIIVVPNRSRYAEAEADPGPRVVRLKSLLIALGN